MNELTAVAWLIGAAQLFGLMSAWLARASEGSARQVPCQRLFMVSLAMVGIATMVSLWANIAIWFFPAFTLALMVLTATCDFGRDRYATTN